MGVEIERKFLVKGDSWRGLAEPVHMRQGYIPTVDGTTVRVRIAGDRAYTTFKTRATGLVRGEWEVPMPVADAAEVLDRLCARPQVEKNRYRIPAAEPGLVWEVDEFLGDNAPLVTAEIELPAPDTPFTRPEWLGDDVTDDHRYKNNNLAAHPYATWPRGG